MFFDFTVEIPDVKGKIIRKKHADTTYVNYEYDRIYLPEKQYTIPKRTTIGKVCEDEPSRMYTNANYLKFFPDAELPEERDRSRSGRCLRIGSYIVTRRIIHEYMLDEMLERINCMINFSSWFTIRMSERRKLLSAQGNGQQSLTRK